MNENAKEDFTNETKNKEAIADIDGYVHGTIFNHASAYAGGGKIERNKKNARSRSILNTESQRNKPKSQMEFG